MIRQEPGAPGQARVIGSLTGDSVQVLLDAVDGGVTVLDLSGVDQVDHNGVLALTSLGAAATAPRFRVIQSRPLRANA
jgi:hypothetical protein